MWVKALVYALYSADLSCFCVNLSVIEALAFKLHIRSVKAARQSQRINKQLSITIKNNRN